VKLNIPREKKTIEVWNVCECGEVLHSMAGGEVLHSMAEGQRGTCSSCWFKAMPAEKKTAMNRLIASAFNGSSDAEKDKAVDEAFRVMGDEK